MREKRIFGRDYTNNEYMKVFLYLVIGGSAAILEWILFYVILRCIDGLYGAVFPTYHVLTATTAALTLSTCYHYVMGNIFVFDSGSRYRKKAEISLVFLVSTIGLLWNLLLMWIFTAPALLGLPPVPSKILASAIVTVWNYLSRKKWVFK